MALSIDNGRWRQADCSAEVEDEGLIAARCMACSIAVERAAIVGEKSVARIFCAVESTSLNPKVRPDPALPQREHQP